MTRKITSLGLALALVLAAAPVMAAGQVVMDEWNQPVEVEGAKGAVYAGPAALKGALAPGCGGNFAGNFEENEGWSNRNAQGPGGGHSDANFDKDSDWK
jgi:hypothetical protein